MKTLKEVANSLLKNHPKFLSNSNTRSNDGGGTQKKLQQWHDNIAKLLDQNYSHFYIADLRMIVIDSCGVDGFNDKTGMIAEQGYYRRGGDDIPRKVHNFIDSINAALERKTVDYYDYSCQAAKRHTLFINVCLSTDNQNNFNAACTVEFINRLLQIAKQTYKNQLAVFDFQDGGYHAAEPFQIYNLAYHRLISKAIIADPDKFFLELCKLNTRGYKIGSFYIPEPIAVIPNPNFQQYAPRRECKTPPFSTRKPYEKQHRTYKEKAIPKKKVYQQNLGKCFVSFKKFRKDRLERCREERKSLTLRLLLVYSLKMVWLSRQIGLKDKDKFVNCISDNRFVQSKIDPFLYIKKKRNQHENKMSMAVLVSADPNENSALIFSKELNKIEEFLSRNMEMIDSFGPVANFQGIQIEHDFEKKCFFLSQKKTIKQLIKEHKIDTLDKKGNPIHQMQPISGKMDRLDNDNFTPTPNRVEKLLKQLMEISRKTRPDICGSVSKLMNYVHKPSEALWKRTTEIALYLNCSRDCKLKVHPMSDCAAWSDASSSKNKNVDRNVRSTKNARESRNSSDTEIKQEIDDYLSDDGISFDSLFSDSTSLNSNSSENSRAIKVDENMKETKPKVNYRKSQNRNQQCSSLTPVKMSQTGFLIRCFQFPITWISELQGSVADYKTDLIELIGAACAAAEIYHIKQLLSELGITHEEPIQLFVDSQIVLNELNRMKRNFDQSNLDNSHFTIQRECSSENSTEPFANCDEHLHTLLYMFVTNQIDVDYIRSYNNIADIFTKAADKNFKVIRDRLNIVECDE